MEILAQYWLFILPLFVIQLALALTALVHVLRHPHYRFGTKGLWIIIVLLLNTIGPIVYFVFGRGEEE
ncbi:PLDc N-terminal domain-containing protein [Paenibacillus brevis]|uniref:PLD nuclease N-terminal domain-containing protein n=1 Tax=Paenibacillus brevis TaxID=2841508 RepID=A0ABS6FN09_9BACL|nr:PLD nuclease N-terminal domain-containing protein [Paenibacillus brevis]MBU5671592.1 PLD nuclease N-terminal domain-containing protein [Paenibacillus brevis]